MGLGTLEILAGFALLLFALYQYLTSNFDFWKVRNVPGPRPIPIVGNFKDVFLGKVHMAQLMARYYREYKKEPLIGIFFKNNPVLMVKDPELIKDVLIRDFNVFCDRGDFRPKKDPFNKNIVNLEYERWKLVRSKLSPVFTSGKLKGMFYLMVECTQQFEKYVEKLAVVGEDTECKELAARFITQVTGSCVFGLDIEAMADENSEFRKHGRNMFTNDTRNVIRNLIRDLVPLIYKLLGSFTYSSDVSFINKIIMDTIEYRKKNNARRNDFVDLLTDLRDQSEKIEFNDRFITGHAKVFFTAGFLTSTITMTNVFYELALNQDVQEKLRHEIKTELNKSNGKLTYDSVNKMTYLDKVVKETLRKHSIGGYLQRKASRTYTFSGTNVTIPRDTKVYIPVWAIHRDPKYYPDPEKFDPSRFDEEEEMKRHPCTYLPFGQGPHSCIGLRFANYQVKVGIIAVINKFKFSVCEKTCMSYQIEPRIVASTPKGGVYLKISNL